MRQNTHQPMTRSLTPSNRLGMLGFVILLGILITVSLLTILNPEPVRADPQTNTNPRRETAEVTPTLDITKTIVPPNPSTGQQVSICLSLTISDLTPSTLDVVLLQDVSGSMGSPITRLEDAKAAAITFVELLPDTDRAAVVPYSTDAYLAEPLTTTKGAVTQTIDQLTAGGGTYIGKGIQVSHQELISSPRYLSETIKTILLLSDGEADDSSQAITRATEAANDGIRIYTIGFGDDIDAELLEDIADIGNGKYYFAPDGDVLATIYYSLAVELHSLLATDVITPGVEVDCSQWPADRCTIGPTGITTVTLPMVVDSSISDTVTVCFSATVNLDPHYEGPINLPGSGICYQESATVTTCQDFDNPVVDVGGRKIVGHVYRDPNANGFCDAGEQGAGDILVRTDTGVASTTDVDGNYVLRTSNAGTLSVLVEPPPCYAPPVPAAITIPPVTGIYTANFGIHFGIHLPAVFQTWPMPSILNGGFEQGWTGWEHGGELDQTIASSNPHQGASSALLGNPGYACQGGVPVGSAWIEQQLHVPNTDTPQVSFWYNIFSQDMNPYYTDEFDSFDVRINGTLKWRDAKTSGSYGCAPQHETDLGWRQGEIDLAPYRGQQVTIRFENRSQPDGWYNTWTFVDDVVFTP